MIIADVWSAAHVPAYTDSKVRIYNDWHAICSTLIENIILSHFHTCVARLTCRVPCTMVHSMVSLHALFLFLLCQFTRKGNQKPFFTKLQAKCINVFYIYFQLWCADLRARIVLHDRYTLQFNVSWAFNGHNGLYTSQSMSQIWIDFLSLCPFRVLTTILCIRWARRPFFSSLLVSIFNWIIFVYAATICPPFADTLIDVAVKTVKSKHCSSNPCNIYGLPAVSSIQSHS